MLHTCNRSRYKIELILLEYYFIISILILIVNPLKPSGNFSYRFKQCYSYESTITKPALLG